MAIATITFGTDVISPELVQLLLAAYQKWGRASVDSATLPKGVGGIKGGQATLARGVNYVAKDGSTQCKASVSAPLYRDVSGSGTAAINTRNEGQGAGILWGVNLDIRNRVSNASLKYCFVPLWWIEQNICNLPTISTENA